MTAYTQMLDLAKKLNHRQTEVGRATNPTIRESDCMAKSPIYAAPLFRNGEFVFDDVRGEVEIVGLTDATIPGREGVT